MPMNLSAGPEQKQALNQRQVLSLRQQQGVRLLAMSLPELRAEIAAQMAANPAIEDIDHPLETPLSVVEQRRTREEDEARPDYPEDDFVPGGSVDEEAAERRQRFFDNQIGVETLQQHLLAQLPLSDIPRDDWPMVTVLVGDLNEDGFYTGSVPDVCMAFGRSEREVATMLSRITELDPPGCGARTARECLLAQIDKLEDSPYQDDVHAMVDRHLDGIAAGRFAEVMNDLGLTREQYVAALKELRTLNPHPGREFPSERDRAEYVNPEVHAVKSDGHWYALTDRRSLPEIKISQSFQALLRDASASAETKDYVRERLEAARMLQETVAARQETLESVAQATFDRQQDFFERGFAALKPLTETEIAEKLELNVGTVSRTVRDKYVKTPFGTVELRRFFSSGVKGADGAAVAQEAVLDKLRGIIAAEDKRAPKSDQKLAEDLAAAGYPISRRTVAKYREMLKFPNAAERKAP